MCGTYETIKVQSITDSVIARMKASLTGALTPEVLR